MENNRINKIKSSFYLKQEALRWNKAYSLLINDKTLVREVCIMASFSCELLLKSLLLFEDNDVEVVREIGHNLKTLFDKLNDDTKSTLESRIFWKQQTINYLDTKKKQRIKSFRGFLECVSEQFVELRYNFEKFVEGDNIICFPEFIIEFNKKLIDYINEIDFENELRGEYYANIVERSSLCIG